MDAIEGIPYSTAEFDKACRAIVSATLLSAVAQGLLAGVGFYFCGLRSSVALLMLLSFVLVSAVHPPQGLRPTCGSRTPGTGPAGRGRS